MLRYEPCMEQVDISVFYHIDVCNECHDWILLSSGTTEIRTSFKVVGRSPACESFY